MAKIKIRSEGHLLDWVYLRIIIGTDSPEGFVKGKAIAKDASITEAKVRSLVNALRQMRIPVCATSNGYWLSTSKEEVRAQVVSLEGRVREIARAVAGLRRYLSSKEVPC